MDDLRVVDQKDVERTSMAEVSASKVMELRGRTGLGMMECKKALLETGGDIGKAEDLLRIKSGAKASKAADRVAAEGVIGAMIAADGKTGALIELNCETDFVARNADFVAFAKQLAALVVEKNPADVSALPLPLPDGRGNGRIGAAGAGAKAWRKYPRCGASPAVRPRRG